jgi:hypothetical protein
MDVQEWSKSNVDYGRKLVHSGLEGARTGGETYLHGKSLAPELARSTRSAVAPALLGACLGAIGGYYGSRRKSLGHTVAVSLASGAAGFAVGLLWSNRKLAASVASGAAREVEKVRGEHWMEKNSIAYA